MFSKKMKTDSQYFLRKFLIAYVLFTFLYFLYAGYTYLKEQVYDVGYNKALIDIANASLTAE